MEEILREVIVISDDEDDDNDDVSGSALVRRDSSVEIISSHAFADDVQVRPVDYRYEPVAAEDEQPCAIEYMVPAILQRVDRRYQGSQQRARDKFGRRGFSRYKAWDQAIDRYRKIPSQTNQPVHAVPLASSSKPGDQEILDVGYRSVALPHKTCSTLSFIHRSPRDVPRSQLRRTMDIHQGNTRDNLASTEVSLSSLTMAGSIISRIPIRELSECIS